jgi:N-acetylglucosamine-6-sulfatase
MRLLGTTMAVVLVLGSAGGVDGPIRAKGPAPIDPQPSSAPTRVASSSLPNILLIVADDQTAATFSPKIMPTVFADLVDKGVRFARGYVETPACCPSRSQILTGLYGTHNGVGGNTDLLQRPTIVQALHDMGYRTSLAGKYLNGQSCNPIPEFDQWVCGSTPPASGYSLVDPDLDVDGTVQHFTGYSPDIEAEFTAGFIADTPPDQPFFAMFTPTTPHLPADDTRCNDLNLPPLRPPSYDEDTEATGKPAYLWRGPFTATEIADTDARYLTMARASRCLDDAVATVLDSLGAREQDTIVFYLSDNGFLYGQHRWKAKAAPYEEAVRMPFLIRYPALVPETEAFKTNALVENVDIASTIADLVGIPWGADGTSLVPLLTKQQTSVRSELLLEWCETGEPVCAVDQGNLPIVPSYFAVVDSTWKYVEYETGEKELYDLAQDRYELTNQAGDPQYAGTESSMAAKLASLKQAPPPDTTIVTGPRSPVPEGQFTYFSQSRFATAECRLDVGPNLGTWEGCGNQAATYAGLSAGDYVFNVRETDEFGVTDPTPASWPFAIADATEPIVSSRPLAATTAGAPGRAALAWPRSHRVPRPRLERLPSLPRSPTKARQDGSRRS